MTFNGVRLPFLVVRRRVRVCASMKYFYSIEESTRSRAVGAVLVVVLGSGL